MTVKYYTLFSDTEIYGKSQMLNVETELAMNGNLWYGHLFNRWHDSILAIFFFFFEKFIENNLIRQIDN